MKNTYRIIVFLFLVLTAGFTSYAQDDKYSTIKEQETSFQFINIPKSLTDKVNSFFDELKQNSIKSAYEKLLASSPLRHKDEQVNILIEQTKKAIVLYGNTFGCEAVSSETASPSLIRLRYLGLNATFPMRWIFTFYNSPQNGWVVVNVKIDDMCEYFFSDD